MHEKSAKVLLKQGWAYEKQEKRQPFYLFYIVQRPALRLYNKHMSYLAFAEKLFALLTAPAKRISTYVPRMGANANYN
jgi:hypothetical protein